MKISSKKRRCAIITTPIIIILLIIIIRPIIFKIPNYMPDCVCFKLFNIYCPGCGNTRAVLSLLHGNLLNAIRNNAVLVFLILVSILFYIEKVLKCFGISIHIIPRKRWILPAVIIICFIYFIIRNFIPVLMPL